MFYGSGYHDGLERIEISPRKLYDLLRTRVGKKKAKAMAYSKRLTSDWKKATLREVIGHSHNLKDIRLLYLYYCELSPMQQVILQQNRQKYVLRRHDHATLRA